MMDAKPVKEILSIWLEFIIDNAADLSKIAAFLVSFYYAIQWGGSAAKDDPAFGLLAVLLVIFFVHPILKVIFGGIAWLLKGLCEIILVVIGYNKKSKESNYESNDSYKDTYEYFYEKFENMEDEPEDSLNEALKFYGLSIPFSSQTLKEKRRELMKKAHPDAGGSTEQAEKVNVFYEVLEKYAS